MSIFLKILLIVIIFSLNYNEVKTMHLTYPNGGEIIEVGELTTISWESSTFQYSFDVCLWNGSSKTFSMIASEVSSTISSISWLPGPECLGENCRIKIVNYDSVNFFDFSDTYFNIVVNQQNSDFTNVNYNIIDDKNVIIYPNPSNKDITVEWVYHLNPLDITLINLMGIEIMNIQEIKNNKYLTLNVSGYPKGIYFIKLKFPDTYIVTKKIIIQ